MNRIELAEEIQHGIDRGRNEASRAWARNLNNEEFHAEVFDRILRRYNEGSYTFLTAEDIQVIRQAVRELRGQ